ncbi:MAG: ATP-binding cassette domain-containing protein [Actinomycetota bacterium]
MNDSAIVVEGLTKHFGHVQALRGIDFEVPRGTVFGLLGPNGAGKTTAIRILSTILRPDSGRATVLGHDVMKEPAAVRYRIGLAGQFAAVDPNLTGRENLRLMGRLTHMKKEKYVPRADELLERFDLTEAADRTIKTYSGGMRRRLDVAAALMHSPPVLFLDEPTTGLDPQSRRALWDTIRELTAEGSTVLLTTQYLEEADLLAHDVAVIDGGKVIAHDTPMKLKARLGSTVIEMGWPDGKGAIAAQESLARTLATPPEREDNLVRFSADGPGVLIEVLRHLDTQGMPPSTLAVREPSLDDVFLLLTGRHAEGGAEERSERVRAGGVK